MTLTVDAARAPFNSSTTTVGEEVLKKIKRSFEHINAYDPDGNQIMRKDLFSAFSRYENCCNSSSTSSIIRK